MTVMLNWRIEGANLRNSFPNGSLVEFTRITRVPFSIPVVELELH